MAGHKKVFTKEQCRETAKLHGKRITWRALDNCSYRFADAQGWVDEFMPKKTVRWTEESILKYALSFDTITELYGANLSAYTLVTTGKFKHLKEQVTAKLGKSVQGARQINEQRKTTSGRKTWNDQSFSELALNCRSATEFYFECKNRTTNVSDEVVELASRSFEKYPDELQRQIDLHKLPRFKLSLHATSTWEQWIKAYPEMDALKKKYPEFKEAYDQHLANREQKRQEAAAIRKEEKRKQQELATAARVAAAEALRLARLKEKEVKPLDVGGFKRHLWGMFYLIEIVINKKVVIGFGISNSTDDRLINHEVNCAKKGYSTRVLATYCGKGADIADAETHLKAHLQEMDAIVNTGVSGFITEATGEENLNLILDHVKGFAMMENNLELEAA